MKGTRVLVLLGLVGVFAFAVPASALCVKCISLECWSKPDATARDCSSYGTSCATIGYCDGSDCGDFSCGPDQQLVSLPLASEYVVASVRITRTAKAPTAIAGSARTATVERVR